MVCFATDLLGLLPFGPPFVLDVLTWVETPRQLDQGGGEFPGRHPAENLPALGRHGDHHSGSHLSDFQGEIIHRQFFFHVLLALRGTDRRFHHRHRVVRHTSRAESEQRRLGIPQRVDLASQILGQVLEAGFDRPAVGVKIGNPYRAGHLPWQIGENV